MLTRRMCRAIIHSAASLQHLVKILPFLVVVAFVTASSSGAALAQTAQLSHSIEISYGPDPLQKLDLYEPPPSKTEQPAVVLIHGGGWRSGDKRDYANVAHLAVVRGFVAIAINYRLVDGSVQGQWPAQINDAQAAVSWVRAHAAELSINPNWISALGSSAGGHLAAFLAVSTQSTSSRVTCAVDEFGPVDLQDYFHGQTPEDMFGKIDPMRRQQVLEQASPISLVTKDTAPMLIVQGERDTMVKPEQSEKLRYALQKAGAVMQYVTYPGGHGFSGLSGPAYTAQQNTELDFIHKNCQH